MFRALCPTSLPLLSQGTLSSSTSTFRLVLYTHVGPSMKKYLTSEIFTKKFITGIHADQWHTELPSASTGVPGSSLLNSRSTTTRCIIRSMWLFIYLHLFSSFSSSSAVLFICFFGIVSLTSDAGYHLIYETLGPTEYSLALLQNEAELPRSERANEQSTDSKRLCRE